MINELQMGDTMVADGYGKIIEGTLIGSNLGSGIAAHTHSGFIFDAGIRDAGGESRDPPISTASIAATIPPHGRKCS